jgi:hypothetical protein
MATRAGRLFGSRLIVVVTEIPSRWRGALGHGRLAQPVSSLEHDAIDKESHHALGFFVFA